MAMGVTAAFATASLAAFCMTTLILVLMAEVAVTVSNDGLGVQPVVIKIKQSLLDSTVATNVSMKV